MLGQLYQKRCLTHMYSDYLESIQERYMITPRITSKPDAGLLSFLLFALQKEVENEENSVVNQAG